MNDPVTAAQAVLASARFSAMSHEYAPAMTLPPRSATAYHANPLRYRVSVVGIAITSARSVGVGMCEFEASNLGRRGVEHLHCLAPARVAIHIRAADIIEMTGTIFNGRFYVSDVRATPSKL